MSTGTGSTATPHPSAVTPSPTPLTIGTATLSGSECVSDFPSRLPLGVISITLVNRTEFTGRFILGRINDGHSYQELADYIKAGTLGRPLHHRVWVRGRPAQWVRCHGGHHPGGDVRIPLWLCEGRQSHRIHSRPARGSVINHVGSATVGERGASRLQAPKAESASPIVSPAGV